MTTRPPRLREEAATETWHGARRRGGRAPLASSPMQQADGKNRRVRRREKKKRDTPEQCKTAESNKGFETVDKFDYYDLLLNREFGIYYIGWYDKSARRTRRRSLETTDKKIAFDEVSRIDGSGMTGDPISMLQARQAPMDTATVLRDYKATHADSDSDDFNRIAIDNHLIPAFGHVLVDEWDDDVFNEFKNAFLKKGYALGYLSRICAVLRAALVEAERKTKGQIRAPHIPEVMTKEDIDEAPLKGRVMTTIEIAQLIDQACDYHFLEYLIGEINSASRPITMLEADTTRIDWPHRLFVLNPRGRKQTKKYRPTIRIAATWEPWLRAAPPGRLITFNGRPVKSVKKAVAAARKAADLKPDVDGVGVTSYSIRHTLGRYLEDCGVPAIEKSILLGHEKTYNKPTTERYSPTNPRNPRFLKRATAAIEKFVHEINSYTKKWDLLVPHKLKPGYEPKKPREKREQARANAAGNAVHKDEP